MGSHSTTEDDDDETSVDTEPTDAVVVRAERVSWWSAWAPTLSALLLAVTVAVALMYFLR
jgi:hypothetical protein